MLQDSTGKTPLKMVCSSFDQYNDFLHYCNRNFANNDVKAPVDEVAGESIILIYSRLTGKE